MTAQRKLFLISTLMGTVITFCALKLNPNAFGFFGGFILGGTWMIFAIRTGRALGFTMPQMRMTLISAMFTYNFLTFLLLYIVKKL